MKIYEYHPLEDEGELHKTDTIIDVKRGRWILKQTSHPMNFERIDAFENRYVYFLHDFGISSREPHQGRLIALTFWQNQRFLLLQKSHWIQRNENVKWYLGILLSAGVGYAIKTMFG